MDAFERACTRVGYEQGVNVFAEGVSAKRGEP